VLRELNGTAGTGNFAGLGGVVRAANASREPERFPAKWMPVRVKKTRQNKEIEPPFRFNRNGKGSRTCSGSPPAAVDQRHHIVDDRMTHAMLGGNKLDEFIGALDVFCAIIERPSRRRRP